MSLLVLVSTCGFDALCSQRGSSGAQRSERATESGESERRAACHARAAGQRRPHGRALAHLARLARRAGPQPHEPDRPPGRRGSASTGSQRGARSVRAHDRGNAARRSARRGQPDPRSTGRSASDVAVPDRRPAGPARQPRAPRRADGARSRARRRDPSLRPGADHEHVAPRAGARALDRDPTIGRRRAVDRCPRRRARRRSRSKDRDCPACASGSRRWAAVSVVACAPGRGFSVQGQIPALGAVA